MLCLKLQALCLGLLELGAAFQQCVMRLLVCLLERRVPGKPAV